MQRRRVIMFAAALVIVGAAGLLAFVASRDGGKSSSVSATNALPARSLKSGAVEVKVEPVQLDAAGADFKITFDTHSVDLSADMTRAARLEVGGTAWTLAGWSGDGPGGHHRSGELRFTPTGRAEGTARLLISGLPEPVEVAWDLRG